MERKQVDRKQAQGNINRGTISGDSGKGQGAHRPNLRVALRSRADGLRCRPCGNSPKTFPRLGIIPGGREGREQQAWGGAPSSTGLPATTEPRSRGRRTLGSDKGSSRGRRPTVRVRHGTRVRVATTARDRGGRWEKEDEQERARRPETAEWWGARARPLVAGGEDAG